jgi:perosamine synthetase
MGIIKVPQNAIEFFKNNLDEIFQSGNLAEGSWNKKVSGFTKDYTSISHAIPTNSNGAGMVTLLQLYNRYYGRKQVLLQSNTMYGVKTMVKSGNCILSGFIDCREESLMPSFEDVQEAVKFVNNNEELIILLTHIGGIINPAIEKIALYCKENNIILLEDCAHSYGATINGKHSGSFGDAGVYSFYSTKAIFSGEGGIVVTNDDEIANKVERFIMYDRFEQQLDVGINLRQSELQAMFLYGVLQESDKIIESKRKIASIYKKICDQKGINYIDQDDNSNKGNYYKFILLDPKCDVSNTFKNITTKTSPVYDYVLGRSEKLATNHICLPIWYDQDDEMTNKVIKELESF